MRYLETVTVPIADLDGFEGNARRSDMDTIRASVRRFGQYRSVIVREAGEGRRRVILAGNHTAAAMAEVGHTTVRVELIECESDDEARRINSIDNRAPDLGGYDDALLAAELTSFNGDYEGTGWREEDLARLTEGLPDDFPPLDPGGGPAPQMVECPECHATFDAKALPF